MLQGKEWIFFDLGSTLVDESEAYRRRVLEMIDGTAISSDDFYNTMLGFYRKSQKGDKLAAAHYGLSLPEWKSEYEVLYPEAKMCLERLHKKYRLGIIANQNPGTRERLRKFGIDGYFDVVIASAEEGMAKPDPCIFELALNRSGCSADQAVMIGDRLDNDIAPANRLGFTTVRILQGYGRYASPLLPDEIPDYTVSSLADLCGILV